MGSINAAHYFLDISMSKISHIEDKQKPKLKDLLAKYDSDNYRFQQYYDINGHLPESI